MYNGALVRYEVGIQFGAGGTGAAAELAAGAYMIMVESEGITESVWVWRTDVPAKFVNTLGLDAVMFAAADPAVFAWYIKHYGPEVNLCVDHSQIVQLETLRAGIWGTKSLWGRVLTYKGEPSAGGQEKGR